MEPVGRLREAHKLGSAFASFAEVGEGHGISPQRTCLAWELAQYPVVVPIPGASRPESIIDSAAAPDVVLSPEDIARLDATEPG